MKDVPGMMETFYNMLSTFCQNVSFETLPEGSSLPALVYDVVDGPEAELVDSLIFIVKVFSLDKVETLNLGGQIGEDLHCYKGTDSVTKRQVTACSVFASHSAPREPDTGLECRILEIRASFRR